MENKRQMKFKKALNLKIGDVIFTIDSYNVVHQKEVTGVKLAGTRELNVSCAKSKDNLFSSSEYCEHTLSYVDVFFKESDALEAILRIKKSEASSIKNEMKFIQKKLRKALAREEYNNI